MSNKNYWGPLVKKKKAPCLNNWKMSSKGNPFRQEVKWSEFYDTTSEPNKYYDKIFKYFES